jgi:L-alanine-DL-glutamate epimerase-like enolase superfamily enzyme
MKLTAIKLHRLKVPLRVPYKLSLGEIKAFDTVLAETYADDGRVGLGEATLLTGYTHETVKQAWALACRLAAKIVGGTVATAKEIIAPTIATAPFTATALLTAIEMLEGSGHLEIASPKLVSLLALVHNMREPELTSEIEQLLDGGYQTLKIKIGFDADADLKRVRLIQRLVAGRAQLRLDANQAYDAETACRFAAALDPRGIELLEQTCAAGDWQAAQAVAKVATVPLMLDESIYDLNDVDKAAELGVAHYIKYKLMKAGSLERLVQALTHIRTRGMEPVLGNGVASDVGCWMEACIAAEHIGNAGEMNGFLKLREPLLTQPLTMQSDAITLKVGFAPRLDDATVARYRDAEASFPVT